MSAEYQQAIERILSTDEDLIQYSTAITTPTGNVMWVPVVGALLEAGRYAGIKHYVIAVTNKRFLMIPLTKGKKIKGSHEAVLIQDIKSAVAEESNCMDRSTLISHMAFGDILKLELNSGKNFIFRRFRLEEAAKLRDAIMQAKN